MTADAVHVQHHKQGPSSISCAAITISDTRNEDTDKSGKLIKSLLTEAGQRVDFYKIVPDEPAEIRAAIEAARAVKGLEVAILTGGTGLTKRDSTFEVVSDLLDKPLPGFGEIFRMLSYDEIGPAAMMSRATAGLSGSMFVFALPGSSGGVRTAMEKIILPQLSHVVQQIRK